MIANDAPPAEEHIDIPQRTLKLHVLDPRRKAVVVILSLMISIAATGAAITVAATTVTSATTIIALDAMTLMATCATTWIIVRLGTRITELEFWIRRMGAGDLEHTVPPRGHDELTEIAYDLEVLRERSLRSQELDLVRQLSEELQDKNDALEETLLQLQNAQDQMVSKQKLAEIGELAAGVAHEVRNPLNVIANYSATSKSLMEELLETVNDKDATDPEERDALMAEISGDLTENMNRISENCDRASRIIQDVTNMSRSQTTELRPVDFNKMIHEYTILAYQAMRAQDQSFNVSISEDFDDRVGEIFCVPEEISRVIVNISQNACYATNQKRQDPDTPLDYKPTITLSTQRAGDKVTASIRDNGIGMPADIVEKIFNPFFTTKPPDEGTGLGLSLSYEIVRHHGGNIEVESEPRQFTEMRVALPVNATPAR